MKIEIGATYYYGPWCRSCIALSEPDENGLVKVQWACKGHGKVPVSMLSDVDKLK